MIDSLAYLEYVKTLECVVYGCKNPVTAHHMKALGMGSKQRKKQDIRHLYTLPICILHHTQLHQGGVEIFEEMYTLNLWKEMMKTFIRWVYDG